MAILSRSEARQEMERLQPGAPLFMELQDALVRGVGLRALSNGWKVNTMPLSARLLGGALSRADADKAFGAAVEHLNALAPLKGGDAAVALCQKARGEVATLIAYTEGEIAKTAANEKKLHESATSAEKRLAQLVKEEKNAQAEIGKLEERKSGLQSKQRDLAKSRPVPMVGALLIPSRESIARDDQERNIAMQLHSVKKRQAALHKERESLAKKVKETDAEIKASAVRLTQLRNGLEVLKSLVGKYHILSTDIDLAQLRAELGLLKESTVKAMVTELTGTRKMLLP